MKKMNHALLIVLTAVAMSGAAFAVEGNKGPQNVMQIIANHKDLSKFASIVNKAGLQKALEDKTDSYTVFAPSNDAMGKIPANVASRINTDKEAMQNFVKYHVIKGSTVYFTNIRGRRAGPAAMNGETLAFQGEVEPVKVNTAVFAAPDLPATNGVVHVMAEALVPPSFAAPAAPAAPIISPMVPGAQKPHEVQTPNADERPQTPDAEALVTPQLPEGLPDMPDARAPEAPSVPAEIAPYAPEAVEHPAPPAIEQPVQPEAAKKPTVGGWFKKLMGK